VYAFETHDGRAWVAFAPGKGLAFAVELPIHAHTKRISRIRKTYEVPNATSPLRYSVVIEATDGQAGVASSDCPPIIVTPCIMNLVPRPTRRPQLSSAPSASIALSSSRATPRNKTFPSHAVEGT